MIRFIRLMVPMMLLIGIGCISYPVTETKSLMGTEVTISVHRKSSKLETGLIWVAIDSAFDEIERIDEIAFSQELRSLNNMAGYDKFYITDELVQLINTAYDVSYETKGAFRPDLAPLLRLWKFIENYLEEEQTVPESWEIDSVMAIIDSTRFIEVGPDTGFAMLEPEGAGLDLCGIAKGYAVDRAVKVLREVGITAGVVEAGGDLRCWGLKRDKKPWRFAVRHPRKPDEFYTIIEIDSGSVATAGDYENYFMQDGLRYHHIFNPRTGYPALRSISSTVVADNCMLADAYSTAFFVHGPKRGIELADSLDVEALILTESGDKIERYETPGFDELERRAETR